MTQTIQNQQLGFNVASVIRKLLATLAIVSPEWSTDRKFSSGTASGVPKCGRVFFLLVSNMSFFGWADFFFVWLLFLLLRNTVSQRPSREREWRRQQYALRRFDTFLFLERGYWLLVEIIMSKLPLKWNNSLK